MSPLPIREPLGPSKHDTRDPRPANLEIRRPRPDDAAGIHALVSRCPPLDRNSIYCNLLQCDHFAGTCALAEAGDAALGFVSAYVRPDRTDVLFVWQVAVSPDARGLGLGRRLVLDILQRPDCADVQRLHATVTAENTASQRMFRSLATAIRAPLRARPGFDAERHFGGGHESELLLEIGPFSPLIPSHPKEPS